MLIYQKSTEQNINSASPEQLKEDRVEIVPVYQLFVGK